MLVCVDARRRRFFASARATGVAPESERKRCAVSVGYCAAARTVYPRAQRYRLIAPPACDLVRQERARARGGFCPPGGSEIGEREAGPEADAAPPMAAVATHDYSARGPLENRDR